MFTFDNFYDNINETNRIIISTTKLSNNSYSDIFKIDSINNNKFIKISEKTILRRMYYSQIKDSNDNIYTEDYNIIKILNSDNNTILLTKYNQIKQDILSFPNLHKYHNIENIIQEIYDNSKFKLILENKRLIIEVNNKDKETINNIYNFIVKILDNNK